MEKKELIEKCNDVKKTAGMTVPFHAPEAAPKLTQDLLAIKLEALRQCVDKDPDFAEAFNEAKGTLESLVEYYGGYFFKGAFPKE